MYIFSFAISFLLVYNKKISHSTLIECFCYLFIYLFIGALSFKQSFLSCHRCWHFILKNVFCQILRNDVHFVKYQPMSWISTVDCLYAADLSVTLPSCTEMKDVLLHFCLCVRVPHIILHTKLYFMTTVRPCLHDSDTTNILILFHFC